MPITPSSYPISFGLNNIITGQLAVTTTATPLSSAANGQPALYIVLQALKANTVPIYVGPEGITDSTGFELEAGGAPVTIKFSNLALIYAVASADATLSWMALY